MSENYQQQSQEQNPDLESQFDLLENIDIQVLHDAELDQGPDGDAGGEAPA